MFTFSVKLEKWPFHVADLPRTGKKCTEMKEAREGRAKLLFCFIKYAKFVACQCRRVVDLKLSIKTMMTTMNTKMMTACKFRNKNKWSQF